MEASCESLDFAVLGEASGGKLCPAGGFDESAAVQGSIHELDCVVGLRVVGEENSILRFLQYSIGFEEAIAALGDVGECGLFEESGELPECVAVFGLRTGGMEQERESGGGLPLTKAEQPDNPRDIRGIPKVGGQALFPRLELLGVIQQREAAAEFGVNGQEQEIGCGFQGSAAEFGSAGGVTGLFCAAGCGKQQQWVIGVSGGGSFKQELILECSGRSGEDDQKFGGLSELDESEDQWGSFGTTTGQSEESCETGESDRIIGCDFDSFAICDFGQCEQCQTLLEEFGGLEGGFEAARGISGDVKKVFGSSTRISEAQLGAAGDPVCFGAGALLAEDLLSGFEGGGIFATSELLFGSGQQHGG